MENFYTERVQEISRQSVMTPSEVIKVINQMGLDTHRQTSGMMKEEPTHVDICKSEKGAYVMERLQGGPVVFISPGMFYNTVQRVEKWLNCKLFN